MGNVRRHQGDALAVPRHLRRDDGPRHGEVEGDESSGARPVYH